MQGRQSTPLPRLVPGRSRWTPIETASYNPASFTLNPLEVHRRRVHIHISFPSRRAS